MVKMINALTGGEMLVQEDRVAEYKAAGHKLAAGSAPKKPAGAAKPTAAKKRTK